ncbi:hypothetical protein [Croceicoccus naphthovorans]|uniref:hypothetical protein n=1 Tax=Croceicoccus naphthovorans TaxID=1348774 RepID=UPI000A67E641|nr:hypothetical protein [Croceicoccus naphthovorans]MBB3990899.1 hypothetical protein [Croceicoccus naphthovorans]
MNVTGQNFVLAGTLFVVAALAVYFVGPGGVMGAMLLAVGIAFLAFGLVKRKDAE